MLSCSSRISSTPAFSEWPNVPVSNLALTLDWFAKILLTWSLLVGVLRASVQVDGLPMLGVTILAVVPMKAVSM